MKTFYSIVSASPNPNAGDSIAIGIVAVGNNFRFAQFSHKRIGVASKLAGIKSGLLNWIVGQILDQVEADNSFGTPIIFGDFEFDGLQQITSKYLSYLSSYSNGLLKFGEPQYLKTQLDGNTFGKLFDVFIGDQQFERTAHQLVAHEYVAMTFRKESFKKRINESLIEPLKGQVNTNFDVGEIKESLNVPLYFDLELDCFGKNGRYVAAKAMDFEDEKFKSLNLNVTSYGYFIAHLNSVENKDNLYYCIADEPKVGTQKHKMYEALVKSDLFQVVALEETSKVVQAIQESKAQKVTQ